MLTARLSRPEDVDFLAPRLRAEDIAEIKAHSGSDPHAALSEGLRLSEPCYSAVNERDEPVIMFGVSTIEAGLLGCAWMLSSDEIYKHRVSFLRQSRAILDDLNDRWPCLWNVCDERNTAHIMWMKALNYTFLRRIPNFGVEGRTFLEFVRVKRCANP